jgi:Na+/H+ antiporter NhaA
MMLFLPCHPGLKRELLPGEFDYPRMAALSVAAARGGRIVP